MTFKIFRNSLFVGICVLIVSTLLSIATLYSHNVEQVYTDLASEAESIVRGLELSGDAYFTGYHPRNRVTHIAADGTVLYDSVADVAAMGNHLDRQEVSDEFLVERCGLEQGQASWRRQWEGTGPC